MTNPNEDLWQQARFNVAESLVQPYQKRAVLSGDWDTGSLVRDEVERLLKSPPMAEGVE